MRYHPDFHAIALGLLPPLLSWAAVVAVVTLTGYPGVACTTPAAWLMALAVGGRISRASAGPRAQVLGDAALAGALFGFWQAMIFTAAMEAAPLVTGVKSDTPSPFFVAAVMVLLSVPITTALSILTAWLGSRRA